MSPKATKIVIPCTQLGAWITQKRDKSSLSAFAAQHGISRTELSQVVHGIRQPSARIMDALGIVSVRRYYVVLDRPRKALKAKLAPRRTMS